MRRRIVLACTCAALAGFGPHLAARAASGAVDIALVLAVDGSRSVDADEARLQREGYRSAVSDPESILDRAPDGDDVRFADVEVRRTGDDDDDERWVCGSFAVWDEEGSLGPFRDFWVTVARVPGTWADIREVRASGFGRDDFLDRNSARFRACFADDDTR